VTAPSEASPHWGDGVVEVARAVSARRYTSAQYADSCLARIEALEPRVHAWVWLDAAAATANAQRADRAAAVGSLRGVPLGIKDIIDTRAIPTRMGSAAYADNVPVESAAVVLRLEAAGGFVMGKTVTAELAYYTPGATRNPWNPAHTPGGSSSGSAAAVACGFVPAALGTQTNGSVIRPAAYCGCIGFKPSAGLIPRGGILGFSPTLDQVGMFARSVEDTALLFSVLAQVNDVALPAIAPAPRLIAVRTPAWARAAPYAQEHFAAIVGRLRAAGAVVEQRELPQAFERGHALHRTIMYAEGARAFASLQDAKRPVLSRAINALIDEGRALSDGDLAAAVDARRALCAQAAEFFGDADGIVTLPATGEAPAGWDSTGDPAFCTLWTLCGLPALTFPTGRGPQRLPLGTQIVGAPGDDARVLAVATWCMEAMGYRVGFP